MAADNKSKSTPGAPSFYSAAASMKAGPGGAGDKANAPGTDAGAMGKKIESIKVLLEVFGKLEASEEDPTAKDMIRQMSDIAKQYQSKLEGGGGAGDGKPAAKTPTSDGAPGAGAPGGPGGGGAGGGAGAPGSESMSVPA